jgi:RHS repeat-associated protein
LFSGQYTDSDSGLVYMRARYYDPTTGQFMSVDPAVKVTQAPYTYALDNPLTFNDPSGLASQYCVGGGVTFGLTIEVNICYVVTPGGSGVTGSVGASYGQGAGVNIHAGGGFSNAHTPGEYAGPFGTAGGSAQAGFGGYGSTFVGKGGPCNPVVFGGIAGGSVGLGAEAGAGASYTFVVPFSYGYPD